MLIACYLIYSRRISAAEVSQKTALCFIHVSFTISIKLRPNKKICVFPVTDRP